MTKSVLFISANPIRNPNQLVDVLNNLSSKSWELQLWSFYEVPESIKKELVTIIGPENPWQPKAKTSNGHLLAKFTHLGMRAVRAAWRKLYNRTRRDRAWWALKNDKVVAGIQPTVLVAIDSFAVFPTWKLAKRKKDAMALSNLTSLHSFTASIND